MSVKRQATTDLNHDNWDQDDPSEHEEMGSFKTAAKDVIEKRVIKTAKRRFQASGDEPKPSVFSGFGGFNKAQPSSYDFLSNLTNGNKTTNGSEISQTATASSSNLFSGTAVSSPSSGIFSIPVTSSPTAKSMFGMPTPQTSSLFGGASSNTTKGSSLFTATKTNSADNSPFKSPASTLGEPESKESSPKSFNTLSPQVPSGIFVTPNTNSKSLFSTTSSSTSNKTDNKSESKEKDEKKLKYYSKLKGLNESVSDWIKKHVEETPLCILTPIFKDYEKHLKEIQDEYNGEKEKDNNEQTKTKIIETKSDNVPKSSTSFGGFNTTGSPLKSSSTKPVTFGTQNITADTSSPGEKSTGFAFGVNTSSTNSSTTVTSGGFSFGITTSTMSTNTSSSPFNLVGTATTSSNGTAPFSFGLGKPFSFSSNIQESAEQAEKKEANDEEDEPPKVEFTPVVEENSVFDKRCKIFVKKDGNFVDKGVGTLYIKKIEESDKHQLLVRANTTLGNVLVNLILSSGIPTQRLGKNNVMLVCIPTPDAEPPPTPILVRVKTPQEADDLLETLNKYKA